jgi:hypothetical protein
MDPDPKGPKTYGFDGSGFGSGSSTLLKTLLESIYHYILNGSSGKRKNVVLSSNGCTQKIAVSS